MSTLLTILGAIFMGLGIAAFLFFAGWLIAAVFFSKQTSQSQCPYCTKVWIDDTMFKEWWNDKVSFPLHIKQTPYHAERHSWWKRDYKERGFDYARKEQHDRIVAGVEKPLAKSVRPYWEKEYDDED